MDTEKEGSKDPKPPLPKQEGNKLEMNPEFQNGSAYIIQKRKRRLQKKQLRNGRGGPPGTRIGLRRKAKGISDPVGSLLARFDF